MIFSRLFWLFLGILIGLFLSPVLIIAGFILLLALALMPFLIPLAFIVLGALLILIGLAVVL